MRILKRLVVCTAFVGGQVNTTTITLPQTRLQTVCSLIISNTEKEETQNTLPQSSEHYTIMPNINSCLNTLLVPHL